MKRLLPYLFYVFMILGFAVIAGTNTVAIFTNKPKTTLVQTIEQTIDSVVHIANDTQSWQGSGVIISDNLVITAQHVVKGGEQFTVTFNCGKEVTVTRAISSEKYDIGFLWVEESMPKAAKLGSMKGCKLGQEVFVIGSPFGKENFNSLTSGIISGLNRDWDQTNFYTGETYGWEVTFVSDAAAHPGNSGGGVFTMDGVLRGILTGGYSPVLNCSVPVDLVMADIEEIEQMFVEAEYYIEKIPEYNAYRPYGDY